jgi:hypothetical protein
VRRQRRREWHLVGAAGVDARREQVRRRPQQLGLGGAPFRLAALLLVVVDLPGDSHVHRIPLAGFLQSRSDFIGDCRSGRSRMHSPNEMNVMLCGAVKAIIKL